MMGTYKSKLASCAGTGGNKASRRPWRAYVGLIAAVLLAYAAIVLFSTDSPRPEDAGLLRAGIFFLAFFMISFCIAVVAVMAGIGGGVLFTPIMLAFTSVDSLIVRATGLVVAMFSGLISSGPFMKSGIGNLRISVMLTASFGIGALAGSAGAVGIAQQMGNTGEALVRMLLGLIVGVLGAYFLFGSRKVEWPVLKSSDRLASMLDLRLPYHEKSTGKVVGYNIRNTVWGVMSIALVGLMSGFFGLGGGWAIVPVQNLVMGLPLKVACANSGVIIGMGDCVAAWPYMRAGAMVPLFVAPWLAGQVAGGIVGARFLSGIKAEYIRHILVGILFFTSFSLIGRGLFMAGILGEVSWEIYLAGFAASVVISLSRLWAKPGAGRDNKPGGCKNIVPDDIPEVPLPQRVYGRIVYSLALLSAFFAAGGGIGGLVFSGCNLLSPPRVYLDIFGGMRLAEIWAAGGTPSFPGVNFYLQSPMVWDGLIQLGIVLGCASAGMGLFCAGLAFIRGGSYLFAALSAWIVLLTCLAASGALSFVL